MKIKFSLLLIPIIAIALFMGFVQISSDNDVFDRSMLLCCNNGLCHDTECDHTSGISVVTPRCPEYGGDCWDCMDVIWFLYNALPGGCGYDGEHPLETWCCKTSTIGCSDPADSSDRYYPWEEK